ncbi:MAG: hypothetical protein D6766_04085 [Verrucomicrobia bacterium]|nr:MAG: hypothetical protein D6766_04085 [Verrucomicrobiota bacterium]
MPVPWTVVRDNPVAWGYRWDLEGWAPGGFLSAFTVIRDPSLDLPEKEELFRPEIDYPETAAQYAYYVRQIEFNRSIPAGWVRGRFKVLQWMATNAFQIPMASRLEVYSPGPGEKRPARVFTLTATGFAPEPAFTVRPPVLGSTTRVADYRYKRWNDRRIFKYAEYSLDPGQAWPTDHDPALLAQADAWMKHGRPYTNFIGKRQWFAWSLLAVLLIPALLMWIRSKHNEKNRK